MSKRVYLKPARADLKVRKPDRTHLPAEGDWVDMDTYWDRRIKAGDVVKAKPTKTSTASKE